MSSEEALEIAEEAGLDLVLMSPDANPRVPHHELLQVQVRAGEEAWTRRAAVTRVEVKETQDALQHRCARLRGVRLKSAKRIFLDGGDRVKVICQFRGRGQVRDLRREMFMRFVDDVGEELGNLEGNPSMEDIW